MNALDLFSGACGGWSLGLHRAGFRTLAAVEIDEWRRRQFGQNFPDAKLYDDVRTVSAARLARDGIGPIDLVCGSPPCQDASSANTKGRGIDGERTGLYMEAVRIVGEIRPRWCAFENVPGIRNRGIDRVLSELEAAGYATWPLVVGALDLGAPHIRRRSWVIGADAETMQRLALPWDQSNGNSISLPPDSQGDGRRPWREGRPDPSSPGQQGGFEPRSFADSSQIELGKQPGRRGRESWPDPAEPVGNGQSDASDALQSEPVGRSEDQGRSRRQESLERLEGAIADRLGSIAENWNGGIAGRFRVDDGLPKGMARPMLAAFGDTILPQISEIIGRAIMMGARA